ncbi:MAG: cyclopropane-fatty-acyl-phospholipid synthase family protein [Pseudomonadota bacterium]
MQNRLFAQLEGLPHGTLSVTTPEGTLYVFGSGEPHADIEVRDWGMLPILLARGDIGFGETYVAGMWTTSSVEAVTALAILNWETLIRYGEPHGLNRLKFWLLNRLVRMNSRRGASRNIRAHYDVGNEFYQLWLDDSMTYSSALFANEDEDLEAGQRRKYDRILDKLPGGARVLEIGCGWGGFAERAVNRGRDVTGLTISPSQKGYADARLDGRADIRLQDYRDVTGKFDNIVSIEMIEAVGERFWPVYFKMIKERLAEGGRAMIQAITVPDENFDLYRRASDYIRHYTFPGGMLLCDAAISREAQRAGLVVKDRFAFGEDYARTCRQWDERLNDARQRITSLGYGEPFLRSWHYYLGACAAAFAVGSTDVLQVELAHQES